MSTFVPAGYVLFQQAMKRLGERHRFQLRQLLYANDGNPPEFAIGRLSLIMDPQRGPKILTGKWWAEESNWAAAEQTGEGSVVEVTYEYSIRHRGPIAVHADLIERLTARKAPEALSSQRPELGASAALSGEPSAQEPGKRATDGRRRGPRTGIRRFAKQDHPFIEQMKMLCGEVATLNAAATQVVDDGSGHKRIAGGADRMRKIRRLSEEYVRLYGPWPSTTGS